MDASRAPVFTGLRAERRCASPNLEHAHTVVKSDNQRIVASLGDHANRAPARYALAVLSLAGLIAFPLTGLAAFRPEDVAAIQAVLAGKAVVEGALVPRGFAKVAEAEGDLNGDGADDVALIVRRAAKKQGSGRASRRQR